MIFSSTEHESEFERRVGDDKQFGKPKVLFRGLDIRGSFLLGTFLSSGQRKVPR